MKTNDPPILAARIFSSPGQQESFSFRGLFFFTAFLHWRTKKVRTRTIFSLQNHFFFDIYISLFLSRLRKEKLKN